LLIANAVLVDAGYDIKKGTSVNLDVVSIHHDPAVFADPGRFHPDRFDQTLKPYSFLGFGSGPRMCPGMNLARLEICVFVHHLVCRYRLALSTSSRSEHPLPNAAFYFISSS
jgi:cytochrome P450